VAVVAVQVLLVGTLQQMFQETAETVQRQQFQDLVLHMLAVVAVGQTVEQVERAVVAAVLQCLLQMTQQETPAQQTQAAELLVERHLRAINLVVPAAPALSF
jgi:DNA-binding protein Fis